jgi:hypothetical protein
MALSLTNETKNSLSLTKESKDDTMTWDSSDPLTWDDDPGSWDAPHIPLIKETKNSLSLTKEAKV